MKKDNAIKYLKHLHELEAEFSDNLLLLEQKELVEALRVEFIKAYKGN